MSDPVVRQLYEELRACQRRLGTALEGPDDFGRVLRLAHDLNNHLTTELMQLSLEDTDDRSVSAVCRRLLRGN